MTFKADILTIVTLKEFEENHPEHKQAITSLLNWVKERDYKLSIVPISTRLCMGITKITLTQANMCELKKDHKGSHVYKKYRLNDLLWVPSEDEKNNE